MLLGWIGDLDELWANKNLLRCKRNHCGECNGGSEQCLFASLSKSGRYQGVVGLLLGQDETFFNGQH